MLANEKFRNFDFSDVKSQHAGLMMNGLGFRV